MQQPDEELYRIDADDYYRNLPVYEAWTQNLSKGVYSDFRPGEEDPLAAASDLLSAEAPLSDGGSASEDEETALAVAMERDERRLLEELKREYEIKVASLFPDPLEIMTADLQTMQLDRDSLSDLADIYEHRIKTAGLSLTHEVIAILRTALTEQKSDHTRMMVLVFVSNSLGGHLLGFNPAEAGPIQPKIDRLFQVLWELLDHYADGRWSDSYEDFLRRLYSVGDLVSRRYRVSQSPLLEANLNCYL